MGGATGFQARHTSGQEGARSIPAWAGQPPGNHQDPASSSRVYPRVGGATRLVGTVIPRPDVDGVYPRVGGATLAAQSGPIGRWSWRSIPAWAGQPPPVSKGIQSAAIGLSPRGRGNPKVRLWQVCSEGSGLSPRGRGNPSTGAGSPGKWLSRVGATLPEWETPNKQVYPRVGGATSLVIAGPWLVFAYPRVGATRVKLGLMPLIGLSPRGRGNLRPRPHRR